MKKIYLLLLVLRASVPVFCQDYTLGYKTEADFRPVYKSVVVEKYDLNNINSGKSENRYGLINAAKKLILPTLYKSVYNAGEPGIYIVKDTFDRAALYNGYKQQFITEAVYYEFERFSNGLALVKKQQPGFGLKWGAVDVNGNIVIPIEYDYLGTYKEGLLNFKEQGRFGFMDRDRNIIIPATNYLYSDFSEGLAVATPVEGGKYGYIDRQNKPVIPTIYEDAYAFSHGYAVVARKKSYSTGRTGSGGNKTIPGEMILIDRRGKELTPETYSFIYSYTKGGLFIVTRNDKYGVIDSTGKLVLPVAQKKATSDNLGHIIFTTADNKYGMINNKGTLLFKPEYEYIATPSNGNMYYKQNGKIAVLDSNLKVIIPADSAISVSCGRQRILYISKNKVKVFDNRGKLLKTYAQENLKTYAGTGFASDEDSLKISYEEVAEIVNPATGATRQLPAREAYDFNEEGIFLTRNNEYSFYDHSGKKLNSKDYYGAVNFSEGICVLQDKYGDIPYLADKQFKKIKELSTSFIGPYSEGLAATRKNDYSNTLVYIDKEGKTVFSIEGKEGGKCIDGRIWIKKTNDTYIWVDKKGVQIGKKAWTEIGLFTEGLAAVKTYNKSGFIDTTGTEVIPLQYDQVSSFTKGAAIALSNGKYILIDTKGKQIGSTQYEAAGNPANGTFPVQKDGKVGLVDAKGAILVDFAYKNINALSDDRVWAFKDGKWGLLDGKGKALTGFIFDVVDNFDNGYAKVKTGDKLVLLNKAGKAVVSGRYKVMGSVYKNAIVGQKPGGVLMYGLK